MEFLHPLPPHRLPHVGNRSLIDRHPSPLDEHDPCSRFPTSSDRFGWPSSFPHPPEPVLDSRAATRYDPLGSLARDEGALARKALCSSFAPRFFPCTVSRGVLSDGTWTTEHPSVHAFLQSPSSRPSLESRTSAAIYSLAALHVFYSPSHPSYEAFWLPNIKEGTAAFVHQVITMKPSPISTAPMTWLGVHDMLWQLTGIQKEYFRSQGVKPSPPPLVPTRRSLRKRKPVQALIQELSAREPSEVPEAPPRKKSKTTKSDEDEKGSEPTSPITLDQPEVSTEVKAGPSEPSSRTKSSPPEMRGGHADATPSPLTITSSLPPESHSPAKDGDVTQTAGTSRGRTKDAAGKKAPVNHPAPCRSSARRARERSPSFSSGSSTAVSAAGSHSKRARSSSSASSTITTVVEAESGAIGKDKGKEKAEAPAGEETDEKEDGEEGEEEEEEEEGGGGGGDDEVVGKRPIRTRRRSTAATRETVLPKPSSRRPGGTTVSQSPAEIDKLTAASAPQPPPPPPPRRVRNRSGVTSSRSRKSRRS